MDCFVVLVMKESDTEKTRRNKRIFNQFFRGKVYTVSQENCDMMAAEHKSKGIKMILLAPLITTII